jgi:hypothetical protein
MYYSIKFYHSYLFFIIINHTLLLGLYIISLKDFIHSDMIKEFTQFLQLYHLIRL